MNPPGAGGQFISHLMWTWWLCLFQEPCTVPWLAWGIRLHLPRWAIKVFGLILILLNRGLNHRETLTLMGSKGIKLLLNNQTKSNRCSWFRPVVLATGTPKEAGKMFCFFMQVLFKAEIHRNFFFSFFLLKQTFVLSNHWSISSKVQVSGISFPHSAPHINKREKEHNILE